MSRVEKKTEMKGKWHNVSIASLFHCIDCYCVWAGASNIFSSSFQQNSYRSAWALNHTGFFKLGLAPKMSQRFLTIRKWHVYRLGERRKGWGWGEEGGGVLSQLTRKKMTFYYRQLAVVLYFVIYSNRILPPINSIKFHFGCRCRCVSLCVCVLFVLHKITSPSYNCLFFLSLCHKIE